MALRKIKSNPPLYPGSFDKPPLLTYINNAFVNEPSKALANAFVFIGADKHNVESSRQRWRVALGRFLQALFFCGTVVFSFLFARDWFGLSGARVTAILLGTCSGLVPFRIFLTADMSLLFWMTACLYFCGCIMRRPDVVACSVLAGACAGLATATKYNGLGVAVALPLAHFLAPGGFAAAWRRRSFYICGLSVPLAFVLANPYSVLDARKFAADFMFNYTVTPVYSGATGTGYGKFIACFPEIFGWPLVLLMPVIALLGLLSLFGPNQSDARKASLILAAVFLLYFWEIGSFPRMETRFVLPIAPVLLLMIAPGWQALVVRPAFLTAIVASLALYGLGSGWALGNTFAGDARMAAIEWARANFPSFAKVESAGACPKWTFLEDRKIEVQAFPSGRRRDQVFREKLGENKWVAARLAASDGRREANFLTPEGLHLRDPDYITVDSFYLGEKDAVPFMEALMQGKLGYRIVFEKQSPAPPRWAYPRRPDFTGGKFYILARD